MRSLFTFLCMIFFSTSALAHEKTPLITNLTTSSYGIIAVVIFVLAYILVMCEDIIHLKKSKPIMLASGIIWLLVAIACQANNVPHIAKFAVLHSLDEYAKLFMFLVPAMTYIAALEERQVFNRLRCFLISRGYSYRKLFWFTGIFSFFLSPIADNLTDALVMCSVIMTLGANSPKFVALGCLNIVIAANAGGVYCPFGDITSLMVWNSGKLHLSSFLALFIPAVVNYVVPAFIISFAIPNGKPEPSKELITMRFGAKRIIALFLLTIATAVSFNHFFDMPAALGMMTGLGYLQLFSYYIKRFEQKSGKFEDNFDIFKKMQHVEWDTLLFFYGIILCISGLATLGYLQYISNTLYLGMGLPLSEAHLQTPANIIIGLLAAIVDNIPMMFAVINMDPVMSDWQWLLITLTTGVGGSLLSIGSAAGVAMMGQAKGLYTFSSHLKWTWAISLGYIASILVHIWLNQGYMAQFFALSH